MAKAFDSLDDSSAYLSQLDTIMDSTFYVGPRLPTVLGNKEFYDLADSSLLLQFPVETGFLVEGEIDLARLQSALQDSLSIFPVFCGNLRYPTGRGQPWRVQLVNNAIEVQVIANQSPQYLPEDSVIQQPWVYSPPLDMDAIRTCGDVPLFKMRVTTYRTTPVLTVVGITSAHVAGDGSFVLQFWRVLSQKYQGLPLLDPQPVYEQTQVPRQELPGWPLQRLQNLFPQLLARNPQPAVPTLRVTLFLPRDQVSELKEKLQRQLAESQSEGFPVSSISSQDCLTALLSVACTKATSLNGIPLTKILNVFNIRGGILNKYEVLNGLLWANANTSIPTDVAITAQSIRKSFLQARNPEFQASAYHVMSDLWRNAADNHERVDFTPAPGIFSINATMKFPYNSVHFGFGEERTHFLHTVSQAPRYVKIFPRNPPMPIGRDGISQTKVNRDGIEISFFLEPELRPRFLKALAEEMEVLGLTRSVEVL